MIEAVGAALSCVGTRFAEAATLRLRYTQVVLDGAVFAKPSTIAFAPDPFKRPTPDLLAGGEVKRSMRVRWRGPTWPAARPRLLSLRGVDVATLTLTDLDLAACLFQGAHHLDQLRIEGARPFADHPDRLEARLRRRPGRAGVALDATAKRWPRKHHWRAGRSLPAAGRRPDQRAGWDSARTCQTPRGSPR